MRTLVRIFDNFSRSLLRGGGQKLNELIVLRRVVAVFEISWYLIRNSLERNFLRCSISRGKKLLFRLKEGKGAIEDLSLRVLAERTK